jgi:hypothetical protein
MKDMERQKFENEVKDAFSHAEVTPSDTLWTNIELDLERAEGGKMKRRLRYYKLMAAASVAFAMCVAGIGAYYITETPAVLAITSNETKQAHVVAESSTSKEKETLPASPSVNETNRAEVVHENELRAAESAASVTPLLSTLDNTSADKQSTHRKEKNHVQIAGDNRTQTQRQIRITQELDQSRGSEQITKRINNSVERKDNSESSNDEKLFAQSHSVMVVANENGKQKNEALIPTHDQIRLTAQPPAGIDSKENTLMFSKINLSPLVNDKKIELQIPQEESLPEPDPVAAMMARLAQREKELMVEEKPKKNTKARDEKLWTSLGFAAGTFNSTNSGKATASSSASSNVLANSKAARSQANAPGNTYSVGVNIGTKVSERWVIQGGVNYLTQVSAYESNSAVGSPNFDNFRAASINDLNVSNSLAVADDSKSSKLVGTATYSVNNQVQFVSVPIQAGFIAVNHKFALQVNAGVSTDLFIKNTITPESDNLKKVTQVMGDDQSDYQPVNFNGLVSTELSYKFGKHYRLALNPGLRYPFSSIYRSETGITSTPLTLDVGMRFRYIFH